MMLAGVVTTTMNQAMTVLLQGEVVVLAEEVSLGSVHTILNHVETAIIETEGTLNEVLLTTVKAETAVDTGMVPRVTVEMVRIVLARLTFSGRSHVPPQQRPNPTREQRLERLAKERVSRTLFIRNIAVREALDSADFSTKPTLKPSRSSLNRSERSKNGSM